MQEDGKRPGPCFLMFSPWVLLRGKERGTTVTQWQCLAVWLWAGFLDGMSGKQAISDLRDIPSSSWDSESTGLGGKLQKTLSLFVPTLPPVTAL